MTMGLMIFGTLLDKQLLELVLNRALDASEGEGAVLAGHSVRWAKGEVFPLLTRDDGRLAQGVLYRDLTAQDYSRLDFYEGLFGYRRREISVSDAKGAALQAQVYWPIENLWETGEMWDCDAWRAGYGAANLIAAAAKMQAYPSVATTHDVRHLTQTRAYEGFFTVEKYDLQFRRFDGMLSAPVNRAVFIGGASAIVLPYDPKRDRVLLIEQFRAGPYARGAQIPWTLEAIAGRIDKGETAEDAARREAREEAGLTLTTLEHIVQTYPSPGSTNELFDIFLGLCDLPDDVAGTGGEASEDEDIRSHLLDWADFDARLNGGGYDVLPLVMAGHWLARNRDRLRASA